MKKLFCFLLCLTLIFSSVSLCFAQDWSATDSQNLQNVAGRLYYMNQSAAYYLYNIATNTNNIYNKTVDIYNALFNNGHNITYWVQTISTWMSPIYTAVTAVPSDLSIIQGLLGYPSIDSGVTTWHSYLKHLYDLDNFNGASDIGGSFLLFNPVANGGYTTYTYSGYYNWRYTLGTLLSSIDQAIVSSYAYQTQSLANNYNASQNAVNWGSLTTSTFTPLSVADGTFKWLSAIQAPVARLSYVLANDQEIEARDSAAANQEAVVDNFIDSSGDGAASPSDIGSVSDLSSGYKQNFGSDASPSGIFDIFNSDHATWFSQETKNQLDTTTPTRLTKGSESETPLLDKQIDDIYNALGVKQP